MQAFHAHLYYDSTNAHRAKEIIELAKAQSMFTVGRFHEKNVGPHPKWSCQLLFKRQDLNEVMPWLLKNRDNLTWFIHPLSGDDLRDHKDNAIWIGEKYNLDLNIFN